MASKYAWAEVNVHLAQSIGDHGLYVAARVRSGAYSQTEIGNEIGRTRERVRQLMHKMRVYKLYLQNRKQRHSPMPARLYQCLRCKTMFSLEGRDYARNGGYRGHKYCSRDCYHEVLRDYRRVQARHSYHDNVLGYRDKNRWRNRSHPQHAYNAVWVAQEDGWLEYKEVIGSERRVARSSSDNSL